MRSVGSSGGINPQQLWARGFTFIEVIVAVAILAVIALSAGLLLSQTLAQQERIEHREQRFNRLRQSLAVIQEDLQQASSRYYRNYQGLRQPPFKANQANYLLDFIRLGKLIYPGQSAPVTLERVRYQLKEGALIRLSALVLDGAEPDQWQSATLLEQVTDIQLGFFSANRWQTSWYENQRGGEVMPQSVSLSFDYPPYGKLVRKFILPGYHHDV